ncbi:protein lifeguard 2 [Xenopus tropicalis]|uniref:Protein lifeguard 2 n=1 Tax=Xenopus tropicalis TaxID=8364 RepID=Q0V9N7_XENTR|eukprot:NP_001072357.1 protein lifeguard 2 [Xenopus tropicalis]
MTQGKVSVSSKGAENDGSNTVKHTSNNRSSAPPSYEEATAGDGKKADYLQATSPTLSQHSWQHGEPYNSPDCSSGIYSGDTEMLTTQSWDNETVRRGFIRKVYAILMIQLLVTVAVVALFTFCDPVKGYIQANPGWYWASYAVFFSTYLVLACCSGPRRKFPWNLILLCIFTLSMAYITGMLSSFYNTKSVILCLGITALVCMSVTLFSFQSKIDFTSCQGVLFVLSMVLLFSGIFLVILIPFQYIPWLHAVYAVIGAIVFTMFLAFDTQMLMGSRRYSLSPEEYIFGALNIYLDIIYIFSFLLQLFGTQE